ncbi:MAG: 3-isopropylmalate dehydratase small subunit [Clostridiales bacterium]|nr:3-isopropylmalate dehydratase small subunit [Clostridiales bacterium]
MLEDAFRFRGRAFLFGDNIDTDAIINVNYLNVADPELLAPHCLEELSPGLSARARKGDILVAGDNFGCGSSREQAPLAIMGCGFSCVVAKSFSRLFYRNAINLGLPAITADAVAFAAEGEEIAVDCLSGVLRFPRADKEISGAPLPPFMLEILRLGGLAGFLKEQLKAEGRL